MVLTSDDAVSDNNMHHAVGKCCQKHS